jgi:hypothetical protein
VNRLRSLLSIVVAAVTGMPAALAQDGSLLGFVTKLGQDMDVHYGTVIPSDDGTLGGVILPELAGGVAGGLTVPQIKLRGVNVQVNDPTQTFIQIFPGFRPFVRSTRSEVSAAAFGQNIVVTYNNSSGLHVSPNPNGPGLITDTVMISGYSTSNDGGQTWKSAFMPPSAGAAMTAGDPSLGVDRHGSFFFANLAADKTHGTIQVNRSTDGGNTWSAGVVVQEDNGSDKEWLAVGPDPVNKNQDNVYVTWTSFQPAACELRFGRSLDSGVTFTAKTIFVPTADPNPTHPQNCLTFTNPVVDSITGVLYIPFLHFSNSDQDFIQMLVSDDAGETFHFATFNIPGAPDPRVMPVTQPGELTECGARLIAPNRFAVNIRLTIHTAVNAGPGITGLPRYTEASRMTLQPALAARNGVLYLAWSNSTSLFFGDPNGKSNVLFVRSDDGGYTWSAPIIVNPIGSDKHHVLPSLAIDENPNSVHITYYTQHSDGTVDLDMANSLDGGTTFPVDRTVRVSSTSFNLPPTNIPIPTLANPFAATNYDRQIAVCYALGEYQSVTTANGSVYAAWGDMRNQITEPVNALDPISGQTHSEEDVFFQKVMAQ